MTLGPFDPFKQLANLRREVDRLFTDFPSDFQHDFNLGGIRVDVHETESEVVALCDLPGLERKEDVNIEVENNLLRISGTINRTSEAKEENMHRKERYTGSFNRVVSLPSPVSEEGVKGSYKNGVLELRMPKLQKNNKNKIDVEFQ